MGNTGKRNSRNSGKSNGKSNGEFGKSNNFCPKYMPPLSEFSHCFCPKISIAFSENSHCFFPNLPLLLPEFLLSARICHCFFPKFGQKQWNFFERPCTFCPKFPIYLKILYFRLGRVRYEKIRTCYCEQVYNSYRLKERSKLYLHNTSPFPKLHYRKFNLFYVSTPFGKALIRKNSQMLQISFFYTFTRDNTCGRVPPPTPSSPWCAIHYT